MAAIVIAAWPLRPRDGEDHGPLGRWLIGATAGFVVAFVAIVAAILLNGSTLSGIYEGMVTEAMRVRDVNIAEFPSPGAAVDWSLAAVAGAVLCVRLRPRANAAPSIWPGLLRAAAGLTIWFTIARIAPFSINPSAGNPVSLAIALAWVAVIAPTGVVESPYKRLLRVLLPALAVAETLQVYPVAGSQMSIAALTFVPVGALCLGDALTSLRAWSETRGGPTLERFGVAVAVVSVALAAQFALDAIARPAANGAVAYRDQEALPFEGAGALHLPPKKSKRTRAWSTSSTAIAAPASSATRTSTASTSGRGSKRRRRTRPAPGSTRWTQSASSKPRTRCAPPRVPARSAATRGPKTGCAAPRPRIGHWRATSSTTSSR